MLYYNIQTNHLLFNHRLADSSLHYYFNRTLFDRSYLTVAELYLNNSYILPLDHHLTYQIYNSVDIGLS